MSALTDAVAGIEVAVKEAAIRYAQTGDPSGFDSDLLLCIAVVDVLRRRHVQTPPSVELLREELHRFKERSNR